MHSHTISDAKYNEIKRKRDLHFRNNQPPRPMTEKPWTALSFTIWTVSPVNPASGSVAQIAKQMGLSTRGLINRLEDEANCFASGESICGERILSKLNN